MISSILRLKNEHFSNQNIAESLNLSVFVVSKILIEHKKQDKKKLTIPLIFKVVEMWSAGYSFVKIAKTMEISKNRVIYVLERRLGDFQNYKIRYHITKQEVDIACQLRQNGYGHPEIAQKINRSKNLTKKIIKENLKDYTKYKYISPQKREINKKLTYRNRNKMECQAKKLQITPQVANFYMNYKPVIQLFDSFIEDINSKQRKKVPLDKFSSLLLENKDQIKKNISKTCNYFFKMGIFRAEKTILGLVLVLSLPTISQIQISNLVAISDVALRDNLKIKNLRQNFGHAIKEVIDIDLILEYLEQIIILIQRKKIPHVKSRLLEGFLIKIKRIKAISNKILRILTEKQVYKKESLILATAIYLSYPLISAFVTSEIILYSLDLKVSEHQILKFQKDISMQKINIHHQSNLFNHLGRLLEEHRTSTLCFKCGNFIYVQQYQEKKIFVCKHCLARDL